MQKIDVAAAMNGTAPGHGLAATAENIGKYLAEYMNINQATVSNQLYFGMHKREGQADQVAAKMAQIGMPSVNRGLIFALWDPVGITIELNQQRNVFATKIATAAGIGADEAKTIARARKRVIADMIGGLLKNAEAHPGPWYDKNYGPDRYIKHIDKPALDAAQQDSKEFKKLNARAELMSKDFVAWKESDAWYMSTGIDYTDYHNDAVGLAYEKIVSLSVNGSGTSKLEREKIWYPALKRQANDPKSWFYQAIYANHRGIQDFIDEEKKWDKEFDGPKIASAIAKTLYEESVTTLVKLHGTVRYLRPANESTAALVTTVSTMLLQMQADPLMKKQFGKVVGRVTTALLLRDDILPKAFKVKGTSAQIALKIQEASSGKTTATMAGIPNAVAQAETKARTGAKLSNTIKGAVPIDAPMANQKIEETAAFVVMRLKDRGGKLSPADLKALGLQDFDLSKKALARATKDLKFEPTHNPYVENFAARTGARVDVVFSAGALFFQIVSFSVALGDVISPKSDAGKKMDGSIGMLTAVMSSAAAILEIQVAVRLMQGMSKEGVKGLASAGVVVGGLANIVEGIYLGWKGAKKIEAGDEDSGLWTLGSGVALASAGGFAIVGGLTAEAAVPVIGWALLVLTLLGLSIYCAINADSTDDDKLLPVEYWLDTGTFGKHKLASKELNPFYDAQKKTALTFDSAQAEMVALQRVLLVVKADLTLEPIDGLSVVIESVFSDLDFKRYYSIDLPRWSEQSRVLMTLFAVTTPDSGTQKFRIAQLELVGKENVDNPNRRNMPTPASNKGELPEIIIHSGGMSGTLWSYDAFVTKRKTPEIKIDKKSGQMRVYGDLDVLNDIKIKTATTTKNAEVWRTELNLEYWPDELDLPELKLELKQIKEEFSPSAYGYGGI
jgi:hypothetical protein